MTVSFSGGSPFALPLCQRATASLRGGEVEVTFYAMIEGQGPLPSTMTMQMAKTVAKALAAELSQAGIDAEVQKMARPIYSNKVDRRCRDRARRDLITSAGLIQPFGEKRTAVPIRERASIMMAHRRALARFACLGAGRGGATLVSVRSLSRSEARITTRPLAREANATERQAPAVE
jgi:hypothetical protein